MLLHIVHSNTYLYTHTQRTAMGWGGGAGGIKQAVWPATGGVQRARGQRSGASVPLQRGGRSAHFCRATPRPCESTLLPLKPL